MRDAITDYIRSKYGLQPDFPWMKSPESAVFRHLDTRKWFALLMPAPRQYLGTGTEGYEDVLTVKCEPLLIDGLVKEPGYCRAYHMNKRQWMSMRMDGTVPEDKMRELLDMSFVLTDRKKGR